MKKTDEVETKEETTTTIDKETKYFFILHKKKKNDSFSNSNQRVLRKTVHNRFLRLLRRTLEFLTKTV